MGLGRWDEGGYELLGQHDTHHHWCEMCRGEYECRVYYCGAEYCHPCPECRQRKAATFAQGMRDLARALNRLTTNMLEPVQSCTDGLTPAALHARLAEVIAEVCGCTTTWSQHPGPLAEQELEEIRLRINQLLEGCHADAHGA